MTVEESRTMQAVQNIARKIDNFTLRDYFASLALAGIMTNTARSMTTVMRYIYTVSDSDFYNINIII